MVERISDGLKAAGMSFFVGVPMKLLYGATVRMVVWGRIDKEIIE